MDCFLLEYTRDSKLKEKIEAEGEGEGEKKEDKKEVKKEDLLGKWSLLFFYPADFTFVCPTELEDLQNHYEQFREYGCEIYAVSCDTHFVHKAWWDHSERIRKITYPMLGDPTGRLVRSLDVMIEEEGVAERARNRTLYRCMNDLPPQYAEVLYLVYIEDRPIEQVCKLLKKTKKQVYNLLARAKTSLKVLLIKEGISYEDE